MKANNSLKIRTFGLAIMIITSLWGIRGLGQPINVIISSDPAESEILPNKTITLTLSIEDPIDFYYFSTEIEFDQDNFSFLSLQNTGLTEGGIHVDGEVGNNRIGISVSRIDTEPIESNGDFLMLDFNVKGKASAGESMFSFSNYELSNSNGEFIELETIEPYNVEIGEAIGEADLTMPVMSQVSEGDPLYVTGSVYASGVTIEEENSERLMAWVGVSTLDSNPANWDETIWQVMDWTNSSDSYFNYTSEVALFRKPGTYYVALRFQLDSDDMVYAGVGGFWDSNEHPSAVLEIIEAPAFRYTIAGWDFSEQQLTPTSSVPVNDLAEIKLTGASLSNSDTVPISVSGGVTYLNTRNWHESEDYPEKYISVVISTVQFEDLQLSSSHTSTPSGPGLLAIQMSLDGDEWEDLDGGFINLKQDNPVHLMGLPIPEKFNDQESVHIRWLRLDDERQSGDGETIASAGAHRIGDIQITGTNINPQRIEVLPGDLNNDGRVDAEDVLTLGHYWMSEGPKPVFNFVRFEPREVEAWIPEPATYADANGDGVVNQKDLLPIGLNFGKSSDALQQQQLSEEKPITQLTLPQLNRGEWVDIVLRAEDLIELKGLSYRLSVEGIDQQSWQMDDSVIPQWAEAWNEQNQLIVFHHRNENAYESAFSFKGRNTGLEVQELIVVRIMAEDRWSRHPVLAIERAAVSNRAGSIKQLTKIDAEVTGSGQRQVDPNLSELPDQTLLYQNYPNPFNPATVISYDLPSAATVRLDVFNIVGQHISTLVHGEQNAGTHRIDFDASGLATGIYLYRLQANDKVLSKSMMLVK